MIPAGCSAVIYFRNGAREYYKIDLDCLPEKLHPIADFNEDFAGWTVIDECIYCIGGRKEVSESMCHTVGVNLNKYDTENPSSTWEVISPDRNLRFFPPSVFALGRNIYVVAGYPVKYDCYTSKENADESYWGEYYNLDSQTWSYLPKQTHIELKSLSAFRNAMDKKTIVFYSVLSNILLFYDVEKEKWTEQHHPDLLLEDIVVPKGLEQSNCCHTLLAVANITDAVVCHSTLYWLNNDLCLYGYDYHDRRWFQSNSLETELHWELPLSPDDINCKPLLFYVDDQTFVAICETTVTDELGMAIIGVEREPCTIRVSLKFYKTFPVDCFQIALYNGMAIRKDRGSVL